MYATIDGKLVDNLQASEVEVLEDGVPQTVGAFEHVSIGTAGSFRARVFVVFLDTYHTQIEASSNQRLPLIKLLDRVIGPDDMVAVMTPETPAGEITFGRKATLISNIMQGDWAWARRGRTERRDAKEDLYDTCYPAVSANNPGPAAEMKARRREKLTLDALDDLVPALGVARDERKAVLTVSDGWVLFRENQNLTAPANGGSQGFVDRLLRRPTKEKSEETGGSKEVNYVECEADRVALAALDHSLRLRPLTEAANRGNISFYSIDPRATLDATTGAEKPGGRGRDTNAASRQDSLRFIADNTDGLLVGNGGNVDSNITRIVDDVSSVLSAVVFIVQHEAGWTLSRHHCPRQARRREGPRAARIPWIDGRRSGQWGWNANQVRRPSLSDDISGRWRQQPSAVQDSHVRLAARLDGGRASWRLLGRWRTGLSDTATAGMDGRCSGRDRRPGGRWH